MLFILVQKVKYVLVAEWFRKLYEWTKLPLVPLYGGFPVKLRYNLLSVVHTVK